MDTSEIIAQIIAFLIVGIFAIPMVYLLFNLFLWEFAILDPDSYLDVSAGKISTRLDFMTAWIKKHREWSLTEALRFLVEEIQKSLQADLCILYLFDQDKFRFAVYSKSLATPPDEDSQKLPREVLKIKGMKKPQFWTEASRTTLSDPNYVRFKDFKAVAGIPLFTKNDFVGVIMIYYRGARKFGPIWKSFAKPLAKKVASVTREIISDLDSVQLTQPDVLRLQIELPSAINVEAYFDKTGETLKAISFLYSFYHILAYENPTALRSFTDALRQIPDLSTLTTSSLRRMRPHRAGSLRIRSVQYGSLASFDLLGVGKVLEVIRDIVKDVVWQGSHDKKMAGLEERSKLAEIKRSELANEMSELDLKLKEVLIRKEMLETQRLELDLAARSLELAQKKLQLSLSEGDEELYIAATQPKVKMILHPGDVTVSIPEVRSTSETGLISEIHKNQPPIEPLGQLPPP